MAVLKGEVTFKVTFTKSRSTVRVCIHQLSFTKNVLNKFMHQHLGQALDIRRTLGLK